MIMSIIGFENKIKFEDGKINVLEIYNKKLFTNFIEYLNEQCNEKAEEDNKIILVKDSKRQKIGKSIFLLTDLFNIELNSKKILNKIYDVIEQNIKNKQDDEINKIDEKWKDAHDKLAYYIEHDELEKVETNFTACKSLASNGEYSQAISELEKTIYVLDHITDKYSFNLVNIF